jgi:hypothetical protein
LDPGGFLIGAQGRFNTSLSVAWGGGVFFVACMTVKDFSSYQPLGARLDATGVNLDPAGIPLPAVVDRTVWNGSNFVNGTVRVGPDGTVIVPTELISYVLPRASDGTRLLSIVAEPTTGYAGQFLDVNLEPSGAPFHLGDEYPEALS